MRTIAMTGSASGIGAATRRLLERGGARVIGCDVRDAEVIADLSTPEGRAGAIDGIREAASGALDGLVLCAGLGPQVEPTAKIVAVNYFGAAGLLSGLRDALAGGRDAAAVAISSLATISPGLDAAWSTRASPGTRRRPRAAPRRSEVPPSTRPPSSRSRASSAGAPSPRRGPEVAFA
jgi:NAD(P)-dependent dehydrogenase (short-subunit alcohol dehydrogenase family)